MGGEHMRGRGGGLGWARTRRRVHRWPASSSDEPEASSGVDQRLQRPETKQRRHRLAQLGQRVDPSREFALPSTPTRASRRRPPPVADDRRSPLQISRKERVASPLTGLLAREPLDPRLRSPHRSGSTHTGQHRRRQLELQQRGAEPRPRSARSGSGRRCRSSRPEESGPRARAIARHSCSNCNQPSRQGRTCADRVSVACRSIYPAGAGILGRRPCRSRRPASAGSGRPTRSAASSARRDSTPADFVYPMFVAHGLDRREPIAAMPGIDRLSIAHAVAEAGEAARRWGSRP